MLVSLNAIYLSDDDDEENELHEIWVNTTLVKRLDSYGDNDTLLYMTDGDELHVQGKPEAIAERLNNEEMPQL